MLTGGDESEEDTDEKRSFSYRKFTVHRILLIKFGWCKSIDKSTKKLIVCVAQLLL